MNIEPFSIQLSPEKIMNLRIHERIFKLTRCPLLVSVYNRLIETDHYVNLWLDTGETETINPQLVKQLIGAEKNEQLSLENEKLVKELYFDAERQGLLKIINDNLAEITICEAHKLANDDSFPNKWIVYRPYDSLGFWSLTRIVREEFRKIT